MVILARFVASVGQGASFMWQRWETRVLQSVFKHKYVLGGERRELSSDGKGPYSKSESSMQLVDEMSPVINRSLVTYGIPELPIAGRT